MLHSHYTSRKHESLKQLQRKVNPLSLWQAIKADAQLNGVTILRDALPALKSNRVSVLPLEHPRG